MTISKKCRRIFQNIFAGRFSGDLEILERLRLDFKERYINFKQLVSANNRALEKMADIERALAGERFFGMSFVRSSATAVSTNVFQMVKKLQLLAPGKYDDLTRKYMEIARQIDLLLREKKQAEDLPGVIFLEDIDKRSVDQTGSKMANLGEIKNRVGMNVPSGFVITASAYRQFFDHHQLNVEIARQMQMIDMADMEDLYRLQSRLHRLIVESDLPGELERAIEHAWRKMEEEIGPGATVAMRSSALGEDEESSSFAGLHLSELNVCADHVFDAYKRVIAGKYSPPAMLYRLNKGFKDEDIVMCVGCLMMIDAVSGGVIYSSNPIDRQDDAILINAAWGLPKAVVDGSVDCDFFMVSKKRPLQVVCRQIKAKDKKFVCHPSEGISRVCLVDDESRNQPSLNEQQVKALARLAIQIEAHYGIPQDIEWAINPEGKIFILQCRPLLRNEPPVPKVPGKLKDKQGERVIMEGGITASPGSAYGEICLVDSDLDILRFPNDAVLLVREAHPRWASLLGRAAGVICEHGSFAGHLANVAREFGVPALFGVAGAVSQLNSGERVTLDATGHAVYVGLVDNLICKSQQSANRMAGSPVYEILKSVSRHITPLNLLEPDAVEFVPENCMTFHDVTRFVHEKAVREMFHFGQDHSFVRRSSKQLYHHVPLQWWVIDLDDGFKEAVKGKYVKLDNIASLPMLAFWEGFAAIPWDGPPPLDGKGFASVVFQSAANPNLAPGVRPKTADRNYIMIAKHYCNLNFWVGYHFSNLEALVGGQKAENFISFQFRGGAADDARRKKRIDFIQTILEENGFHVEARKDNLIARMEGYRKAYMLERIKVLGYLMLHTRQIDMIMTSRDKVNHYRSKISRDIQKIIGLSAINGS